MGSAWCSPHGGGAGWRAQEQAQEDRVQGKSSPDGVGWGVYLCALPTCTAHTPPPVCASLRQASTCLPHPSPPPPPRLPAPAPILHPADCR